MCVVCLEWEKGKLTRLEAKWALNELIMTDNVEWDHFTELRDKLEDEDEGY